MNQKRCVKKSKAKKVRKMTIRRTGIKFIVISKRLDEDIQRIDLNNLAVIVTLLADDFQQVAVIVILLHIGLPGVQQLPERCFAALDVAADGG
jgi:hypothetical protein